MTVLGSFLFYWYFANWYFLTDQTPTPTKFLKNCEEIGLFQDLTKNPFEEAFKKASETGGPDVSSDVRHFIFSYVFLFKF